MFYAFNAWAMWGAAKTNADKNELRMGHAAHNLQPNGRSG
jgi:hypothetical protein